MNHEDLFEMLGGGGGFPGGGFSGGGFPGGGGGLFGSMFSRGGPRRPRKGESTVQPLSVSLEDLYKGKTSKLQLTKKVLCPTCEGYVIISFLMCEKLRVLALEASQVL